MSEQEHTPGAEQAALIITRGFHRAVSMSIDDLAEIIDRETGLPELRKVCRKALKELRCRMFSPTDKIGLEIIEELAAALKKAQ